MREINIIDYVDDYCFDDEVMCKQKDKKHENHDTLSKRMKSKKLKNRIINKLKALFR